MMQKRYQYYSSTGLVWSRWFNYRGKTFDKWQDNKKLKNEYRKV